MASFIADDAFRRKGNMGIERSAPLWTRTATTRRQADALSIGLPSRAFEPPARMTLLGVRQRLRIRTEISRAQIRRNAIAEIVDPEQTERRGMLSAAWVELRERLSIKASETSRICPVGPYQGHSGPHSECIQPELEYSLRPELLSRTLLAMKANALV